MGFKFIFDPSAVNKNSHLVESSCGMEAQSAFDGFKNAMLKCRPIHDLPIYQ